MNWAQSGSDWPKWDKSGDLFFRSDSVHFSSVEKNPKICPTFGQFWPTLGPNHVTLYTQTMLIMKWDVNCTHRLDVLNLLTAQLAVYVKLTHVSVCHKYLSILSTKMSQPLRCHKPPKCHNSQVSQVPKNLVVTSTTVPQVPKNLGVTNTDKSHLKSCHKTSIAHLKGVTVPVCDSYYIEVTTMAVSLPL